MSTIDYPASLSTSFTRHPFFSVLHEKSISEPKGQNSPLKELLGATLLDISRVAGGGGGGSHVRHASWSVGYSGGCSLPSLFQHLQPPSRNSALKKGKPTVPIDRRLSCVTGPMPAAEAASRYRQHISDWEAKEMRSYQSIYFLGLRAEKITPNSDKPNCGFDDDQCDYQAPVNDHLAYRYEILSFLGKGTFGRVMRCYDHLNRCHVAVKIIRNLRSCQKLAETEVVMLGKTRGLQGVVEFKECFRFRDHTCLVFELLNISLHSYLRQDFPVSLPLIQSLLSQLLLTISQLHQRHIVHCDLKPDNILFTDRLRTEVKIIDFGTAVMEKGQVLGYTQTRYYRAPEVLLGIKAGSKVDMWSYGCIAAEIALRKTLFQGENEADQLRVIAEGIGPIPVELLAKAGKVSNTFDAFGRVRRPVRVMKRHAMSPFQQLSNLPVVLYDFILQFLQWEASARPDPETALQHPFLTTKF